MWRFFAHCQKRHEENWNMVKCHTKCWALRFSMTALSASSLRCGYQQLRWGDLWCNGIEYYTGERYCDVRAPLLVSSGYTREHVFEKDMEVVCTREKPIALFTQSFYWVCIGRNGEESSNWGQRGWMQNMSKVDCILYTRTTDGRMVR